MRMLLFYFLILEDNMVLSPFKLPSLSHDFFSLLFPEELWDVLVEQTNIYVAQKQRKSWFNDTNKDEMKAFVGALFFMAVHRLPNFDHYFSHDWVFAVPTIQNVFYQKQILAPVAEFSFG